MCRLRRQAPLYPEAKALRASRITTSATTTRATVVLVLPTISGKMCFVKSFWNASGQSMSISEAMWTVFREEWLQCRRTDQERSIRDDKKKLEQAKKRLADLDVIISRLYEGLCSWKSQSGQIQKDVCGL